MMGVRASDIVVRVKERKQRLGMIGTLHDLEGSDIRPGWPMSEPPNIILKVK